MRIGSLIGLVISAIGEFYELTHIIDLLRNTTELMFNNNWNVQEFNDILQRNYIFAVVLGILITFFAIIFKHSDDG